jgi:cob(I)alamin adenosyltransferase
MTALFVLQTKRATEQGQDIFRGKTVKILLAHIEAYEKRVKELEKRIAELEHYIDEHNQKVLAEAK